MKNDSLHHEKNGRKTQILAIKFNKPSRNNHSMNVKLKCVIHFFTFVKLYIFLI